MVQKNFHTGQSTTFSLFHSFLLFFALNHFIFPGPNPLISMEAPEDAPHRFCAEKALEIALSSFHAWDMVCQKFSKAERA
jgi:hypothetical protein